MPVGSVSPAPAPQQPLSKAADRLRDSARWLVVTFGAIAVVVFAGISFSRFGELGPGTEPGLFVLAIGGAVAALVGALGALFVSMSLAAASNVSTKDLASNKPDKAISSALKTLKEDPALAPWGGKFKDFVKDLEAAHAAYQVRLKDWAESVDPQQSGMLVTRASRRLTSLDKTQGVLLATASYLRLADRFAAARWWFVGWLTLAALGAGAFVWATGTSASESIPRATTPATWAVPVSEREDISARLGGSACSVDLRAVPVTILDEQPDGQHADILTNPTPGCRALHIVIPDTQLTRT
jgi:hypothetical protein